MKNILIVNDDGIKSAGILAAAEAVQKLGSVSIVAPRKQNSGVGRSISLRKPLSVEKEELNRFNAYSVDGTPVDSVIIALFSLLKKSPDLVISGINLGENMSSEITTSGTVCAAIEAANHNIPAIAISLHLDEDYKFGKGSGVDFNLSKNALNRISKQVLKSGLPEGVDLLNVNVPDSEVREADIAITCLAHRMYSAKVGRLDSASGGSDYIIDGDAIFDASPGTDVYAVRVKKLVSVTPLKLDFTAADHLNSSKLVY